MLTEEFRFENAEVRVSKLVRKVILEPFEPSPFDVEPWWKTLQRFQGVPFPDIDEDALVVRDDTIVS